MYLQGDLQKVFDVLYHMGIINPSIESDWMKEIENFPNHYSEYINIIKAVNTHQGDVNELVDELSLFNRTTLNYLAMEVAREFADFQSRKVLH